ncbi:MULTISPECIES: c-type cytochrome [unclassified Psychrobacter]|uniref:c-type cytochrome n=1 Tax=unclassified Psychrobacter TaxID=196806 RepID=UPI0018F786D1|nr:MULTISPECIES: c-type cytochrome [unclassified Psychrobacter]
MTVMIRHQRYGWVLALAVASGLLSACGETQQETPPAASETTSAAATAPETVENTAAPSTDNAEAVADSTTAPVEQAPAQTADTSDAMATDATATDSAPLSANAGKTLYETRCKICHEGGMLNAPRLSDKAAWAPRLAKGKETLYQHSANGFNKMPAQATDDVSVAEVQAAVDYMVAAVSS